jgi:2-C-methyl-D-erythritol 4-phosphate cytidylyltransferase
VPKAFIRCAGRELWEWSAEVLARECDEVVFAVPADRVGADAPGAAGSPAGADAPGNADPPGARIRRIAGGAARSESVRNAMAALPDADIVVVHDAARPFASADLVRACIAAVEAGADAAVAATPVTDTIKEADDGGRVIRTLDRSHLWSIQTPQAFRAAVLRRALEGDVADATDDASLVEAIGGDVRIVEAPASNFKITWPEDLARAESLLC